MSTSYYKLKPPVTSLRVEDTVGHKRITVFVNHENAGSLTLRAGDEVRDFLRMLAEDDNAAMHRFGAGYGRMELSPHVELPSDQQLVSEYGEVFTVSQIKREVAESPINPAR